MRGIRSKDTKPEIRLRKALFARGFRYRLHGKKLLGKPDLVLARWGAVIFIHGCFWHQHKGCRISRIPGTKRDYWIPKLEANTSRDLRNRAALMDAGWRVAVAWECGIRKDPEAVAAAIAEWLHSGSDAFGEFPPDSAPELK